MKNIKKIALALTVATFALGFSAFKTAEKENRFSKIYYQMNNGKYTSDPELGICSPSTAIHPCTLNYTDSTPIAEDFDYANRPQTGTVVESSNGFYQ